MADFVAVLSRLDSLLQGFGTLFAGHAPSGAQLAGTGNQIARAVGGALENLTGKIGIGKGFTAGMEAGISALEAFTSTVEGAARQLEDLRAAATISGGTSGQVQALSFMGVAPGQVAGTAAGLRQRISGGGDPFAQMEAQRAGIGIQLPRPFGATNEAEILKKAFDYISEGADQTERLTRARRLELDAFLPQIEAYRRMRGVLEEDLAARKQVADGLGDTAMDLVTAGGRVKENWDTLTLAFAGPVLQDSLVLVQIIADGLKNAIPLAKQAGELVASMMDGFLEQIVRATALINNLDPRNPKLDPDAMVEAWHIAQDAMKALNQINNAQNNQHTQATQDNTDALKDLIATLQGTFGGGQRAQGAIPRELKGPMMEQQLRGRRIRLGAFT